jgi:hypothetical protein
MSVWVLVIAVCIGICLGIVHGILMLLSPTQHRRFIVWLNSGFRRPRLSPLSHDVSRDLELEYRLAGLGILVMCGWLAWELQGDVRDRLFNTREHLAQSPGLTAPLYSLGGTWAPLAIAIATGLSAFYFLRSPDAAAQWATKNLPLQATDSTDSKWSRRGMQFLGACFLCVSLYFLWVVIACLTRGCR